MGKREGDVCACVTRTAHTHSPTHSPPYTPLIPPSSHPQRPQHQHTRAHTHIPTDTHPRPRKQTNTRTHTRPHTISLHALSHTHLHTLPMRGRNTHGDERLLSASGWAGCPGPFLPLRPPAERDEKEREEKGGGYRSRRRRVPGAVHTHAHRRPSPHTPPGRSPRPSLSTHASTTPRGGATG